MAQSKPSADATATIAAASSVAEIALDEQFLRRGEIEGLERTDRSMPRARSCPVSCSRSSTRRAKRSTASFVSTIYNLDLDADLVVLSACSPTDVPLNFASGVELEVSPRSHAFTEKVCGEVGRMGISEPA